MTLQLKEQYELGEKVQGKPKGAGTEGTKKIIQEEDADESENLDEQSSETKNLPKQDQALEKDLF